MPPSRTHFLRTPRLGFGLWTEDDLPLAIAVWGDPQVTRYVGGPFSREQVAERLDGEIASMSTYRVQYWPIFLLESGEHVGAAGMRVHKFEEQVYAVGYYLKPNAWGKGFAMEAGRAIITYAFETTGANGLFAGHHPENKVSGIILEKLGFRFTHTELYPPTGLLHQSYWLPRPAEGKTLNQ